jgi:hypothetical protein
MLVAALEAEVDAYVSKLAAEVDEHGRVHSRCELRRVDEVSGERMRSPAARASSTYLAEPMLRCRHLAVAMTPAE